MTLLNLLGNIMTPDYSTLYLVESDIMLEAQKREGAVFKGVVGKLVSVNDATHGRTLETPPWVLRRLYGNQDRGDFISGSFDVEVDELGIRNTCFKGRESESERTSSESDRDSDYDGSASDDRLDLELSFLGFTSPAVITSIDEHRVDSCDTRSHHSESDPSPSPVPVLTQLPLGTRPDPHISLQVPACSSFERRASLFCPSHTDVPVFGLLVVTMTVNACIIVLLGYLSDWFDPGKSTHTQRVWIILWLISGLGIGLLSAILSTDIVNRLIRVLPSYGRGPWDVPFALGIHLWRFGFRLIKLDLGRGSRSTIGQARLVAVLLTFSAPAIGGFVIVGQMIREYGNCIRL
jgi:hypothetical protein